MPRVVLMTWVRSQKRWTKMFRGVRYYVSPKQLGTADARADSLQAANEWWRRKQAEIETGDEIARVRAELIAMKDMIGEELYSLLTKRLDRNEPESLRYVLKKIALLKELEKLDKQPYVPIDHGLIDFE